MVTNEKQAPDPNGKSFFFLVFLEDVFLLKNKDEKDPEIFGLFSTTR